MMLVTIFLPMQPMPPSRKGKPKIPTVLQQAKELQARLTKAAHKVADDLEAARSKDLRSRLANSLGSLVRSWREVEDAKRGIVKKRSPTPSAEDQAIDEDAAAPAAPAGATFEEPDEPNAPEKISKESLSAQTVPTPTREGRPDESGPS